MANVCGIVCKYAHSPMSGAKGSCGLIVCHTFGFNSFRVVVIHHLVWDFCQNTLSQGSWGGLKKHKTERRGVNTKTQELPHLRSTFTEQRKPP